MTRRRVEENMEKPSKISQICDDSSTDGHGREKRCCGHVSFLSSFQPPTSRLQTSRFQLPTSHFPHPTSRLPHPASNFPPPISHFSDAPAGGKLVRERLFAIAERKRRLRRQRCDQKHGGEFHSEHFSAILMSVRCCKAALAGSGQGHNFPANPINGYLGDFAAGDRVVL